MSPESTVTPTPPAGAALRPSQGDPVGWTDLVASFDSCRANDNGPAITGITLDSRQVRPGDLYVGLHGLHAHGASFAASAVESGAVAVLTDEDGATPVSYTHLTLPTIYSV